MNEDVTLEELLAGIRLMDRLRRKELKELEELDEDGKTGLDESEAWALAMERREMLKEMMEYLQGRVDEVGKVSSAG